MSSMKPLFAVALVVAGLAIPACAQRGGSRGGAIGHGGGFATHSAPPSRAGFPSVGRTTFLGAPQLRYGANHQISAPARGPIDIDSYRRIGHPIIDRDRYRRPYLPIYAAGFAYTYPAYFGSGYLSYPDYAPSDDPTYVAPQQPASYAVNESEAPVEQAQATPPESYRPPYVRPQTVQDLGAETPVTLIFKDGRPSEQIQNYMLTRTTLYVQEQHLREIAVDDLDLPATQRANRPAGVDFQLPGIAR